MSDWASNIHQYRAPNHEYAYHPGNLTNQRMAAGLPPKAIPTPEQRMWAFERIYPSLTDVETLKQVMRHAEDLAQWVANGNEA